MKIVFVNALATFVMTGGPKPLSDMLPKKAPVTTAPAAWAEFVTEFNAVFTVPPNSRRKAAVKPPWVKPVGADAP